MHNLLLHPHTERKLNDAINRRVHALLIVAPEGSGKRCMLQALAAEILGTVPDKLQNEARFFGIYPETTSVSIEQIRAIQHFLTLKTTGRGDIRRVIAIESADTMSREAQNALLKTLEEPPTDTMIIMGVSQAEAILPTIYSRVQTISVTPPTKHQAVEYFKTSDTTQEQIERLYDISGGAMGLLTSLVREDTSTTLVNSIDLAKKLLAMSQFERLTYVDELSKQKEETTLLLLAFKRIFSAALLQTAQGSLGSRAVSAWHARLAVVVAAEEKMQHKANAKLLLTDIFMAL